MNAPTDDRRACEALSHAYGTYADAGEAEQLAELFTTDGVFDRLGTRIEGRAAIRDFIAQRPRDMWQRHLGSGFTFTMDADGVHAHGTLDLVLERGHVGRAEISETLRARYHDRFVRTNDGWKFELRQVRLLDAPA